MNTTVFAGRPCRPITPFRAALFALALLLPASAHAQLVTLAQTYNVPHVIDGGARSLYYNFSSQGFGSETVLTAARLSIDFAKGPELSDDPPFFSEIGLSLRKLDTSFAVTAAATLIEVGSFHDGAPSSFFDGTISFSDTAPAEVNADPDVLAPGEFRPVQALSLLNGAFSSFWELRIDDASFQNPLLFRSATLTLTAAAAVAVPEPSTLVFLLTFVLGLSVLILRRRLSR